jgi:hypothetical protein
MGEDTLQSVSAVAKKSFFIMDCLCAWASSNEPFQLAFWIERLGPLYWGDTNSWKRSNSFSRNTRFR